jgi:hypothetical protein
MADRRNRWRQVLGATIAAVVGSLPAGVASGSLIAPLTSEPQVREAATRSPRLVLKQVSGDTVRLAQHESHYSHSSHVSHASHSSHYSSSY